MKRRIFIKSVPLAGTRVRRSRRNTGQGTFDNNGWLQVGLCGHQNSLGESYISTGSLYLCSTGLLALGLPAEDPFWADADEPWTSVKIWNGENLKADHAL